MYPIVVRSKLEKSHAFDVFALSLAFFSRYFCFVCFVTLMEFEETSGKTNRFKQNIRKVCVVIDECV